MDKHAPEDHPDNHRYGEGKFIYSLLPRTHLDCDKPNIGRRFIAKRTNQYGR